MSRGRRAVVHAATVSFLWLFTWGCREVAPRGQMTPAVTLRTATPALTPTLTLTRESRAGEPTSEALYAHTATGTSSPVQVTALGNVFIRRGPDLAFNPISVLAREQTVAATGRDVLGDWVRVVPPDESAEVGWISIMTDFTRVSGDVSTLPEISPTVWPELAFIRNCTLHEMMINPVGLDLPSILNFPANDVRVNPGHYVVTDLDVDGYPQVRAIDIREGTSVDVIVDGDGVKRKCPVP